MDAPLRVSTQSMLKNELKDSRCILQTPNKWRATEICEHDEDVIMECKYGVNRIKRRSRRKAGNLRDPRIRII